MTEQVSENKYSIDINTLENDFIITSDIKSPEDLYNQIKQVQSLGGKSKEYFTKALYNVASAYQEDIQKDSKWANLWDGKVANLVTGKEIPRNALRQIIRFTIEHSKNDTIKAKEKMITSTEKAEAKTVEITSLDDAKNKLKNNGYKDVKNTIDRNGYNDYELTATTTQNRQIQITTNSNDILYKHDSWFEGKENKKMPISKEMDSLINEARGLKSDLMARGYPSNSIKMLYSGTDIFNRKRLEYEINLGPLFNGYDVKIRIKDLSKLANPDQDPEYFRAKQNNESTADFIKNLNDKDYKHGRFQINSVAWGVQYYKEIPSYQEVQKWVKGQGSKYK